MPNWVDNELKVSGQEQKLEEFKEQAKTKETALSLNKFIPMPEELDGTTSPSEYDKDLEKKYGFSNWYDWRIVNWGCKWDVEAHCSCEKGNLYYNFDSPWSPPIVAIGKIGEMFPELFFELRYEEEGNGFCGIFQVKNGEIIFDESKDIEYGTCPKCGEESYITMAGRCSVCDETIISLIKKG